MSARVKFMIRAEPSPTDSRTTAPHLIWMQPLDDDDQELQFAFASDHKALRHHERLFTLPAVMAARRDLEPRWAKRIFKVSLPADIAALYIDNSGNPTFLNTMLNVFNESDLIQPPRASTLAAASATETQPAPRSLSSIVKDAVITKFNSKSATNANAWLDIFESECQHLQIP